MPNLIFSGIQPTGSLHLGNYLGAIAQWVPLQETAPSLFCIVDSHAITLPQEPSALLHSIRLTAATYLACGIDPVKAPIFVQSSVAAHAELAWIFNCLTPLGWLNRMTQFKEKSGKQKDMACLGLYAYPVLMAADILLYHTSKVPVGEDQKQHIELTRDIALLFNRTVGQDYFALPEPMIMAATARIMSLRDGSKKMSKSDPSDASRIQLTDDADTIATKFRKAKSDADAITGENLEDRPELKNLLGILAALTNKTMAETVAEFEGKGFSALKSTLAEVAIATLAPISTRIHALMQDHAYLDGILTQGQQYAEAIATKTIGEVKERMGMWVQ